MVKVFSPKMRQTDSSMEVWYAKWDSSSCGDKKLPKWADWYQPT